MEKINKLSVQALKVKEYVAFMRFTNSAIDDHDIISEWFAYYVNRFKASYSHLDNVFLKFDIDACTKAVNETDVLRDKAFRKMRDAIKWYITYPEGEVKTKAADELMRVIELYGGIYIPNQGMTARSATYSNMVDDFEKKFPTDVETLGVEEYVEELKEAQEQFDEKYMARAVCESELVKGAMVEARKRMDEDYKLLVDAINVKRYEDTEGRLNGFISLMNVEIGKNRTYTGQGQASSSAGGSGSGTDEGEVVVTKTATFDYINGNSVKLKVEVGSPLVAPEVGEGCRWEPEVPELMPKKNVKFKEVPLSTEEAVATFHFADHREEEIRQLVGSVLTAPQNTEGYYWEPEVPATMPEEDTSYYELPEEEENGGSGSGSEEHDYEYVNPDNLDPAENITIEWLTKFKGTPIKKMIVPLDGQITQDDVPDCPTAGYVWNHSVQDINRQISNNGFAGKVISCYPYDPDDMGVR